jgi:predicted negative regulator of RcsB-dependent stress response
MTGTHVLAGTSMTTLASGGTNLTPVGILLAVLVPICAALAVIFWNYYRLQRHRADAVAMASYRKLAEEAVANMQELRTEMAKLTEHVTAVEQLMRDVG